MVNTSFKSNPTTSTSQYNRNFNGHGGGYDNDDEKRYREAREKGIQFWDSAKHYILRPSVAGGLLGLVNIGLLAGAGRAFYINPDYRTNSKIISSTLAAALVITSAEGYAAEQFHQTQEGKRALKQAQDEGSLIYRHLQENILRPGYLGGLVGLVNSSILGVLGYYSYQNWDKPTWDGRTISAVSVGLLTLWAAEGFGAERYSQTPEGQEAKRKAKKEGSLIYQHLREVVMRPGVLGGIVGFLNLAALSTVGYLGYTNWDKPTWDRRTVSVISAGLLSLWAGEGFLAERYRENRK